MTHQPPVQKVNPYIVQQIHTSSPEKLILLLYDLGIKCCRTKDRDRAAKVLVELISALNFEHREIALNFYDLYKYSLDQVHKNEFEKALTIFKELRDVWQTAVVDQKTSTSSS